MGFISLHLFRCLKRASPVEFTMHLLTPSIPAEVIVSGCWFIAAWDPADKPGEHLCCAVVTYRRESRYSRNEA